MQILIYIQAYHASRLHAERTTLYLLGFFCYDSLFLYFQSETAYHQQLQMYLYQATNLYLSFCKRIMSLLTFILVLLTIQLYLYLGLIWPKIR